MEKTSIDIERQLENRFSASLDVGAARRIVIWHDEAGEFEETFDAIAEDASLKGASVRPVRFVKAIDGNLFATKMLIEREDTESDLLVYRNTAPGDLQNDWLADVELYSETFQADRLSMMVDELGAADTSDVRAALAEHREFFASKDRAKRFAQVMPNVASGQDVTIGILASILGGVEPKSEAIVRAYAMALDDSTEGVPSEDVLAMIERFGMEDAIARYIGHVTGYENDIRSFTTLMEHLLLSALSETVPSDVMKGLEGAYSADCGTFCLTIIHDWMEAGEAERDVLLSAARAVEAKDNLGLRFQEAKRESLRDADIFPAIDEALASSLLQAIARGDGNLQQMSELVGTRKGLTWAKRVAGFYDLVEAAASMQEFHASHSDGIQASCARDVFDAYQREWWRMDFFYRRFCEAYQRCVAADNDRLIEDAQLVMDWGDNLYMNWFLPTVNDRWVAAAAPSWEKDGYVEGVPLQRRFFADCVAPELSKVKRVAVIISDGLRYAVARQLQELIERKTKNAAKLSAMQATFPSITSFGMAALLPHSSMRVQPDGSILVDGMKTASTAQRQKVLEKACPGSKAVQADTLFSMTSQERKALVADAPVTYIYHNTIDATGEKSATQAKVFEACERAVDEVFDLARMLIGSMGVSRVIVTADHGFLYTNKPLPETERIASAEVGDDTWTIADRYAVVASEDSSELFAKVSLRHVSDQEISGLAPRGLAFIKRPGGGRYAHGGISLQEMCVPVLRIRAASAKSDDAKLAQDAEVQLLDTNRRITSMLFGVRLYQVQPVSGKMQPCAYELSFVDKAGNVVSDVRHVVADRESDEATDRQMDVRFSLNQGVPFSSRDPYYLIVRKEGTGEQVWREQFSIDIAFAPAEDFGF